MSKITEILQHIHWFVLVQPMVNSQVRQSTFCMQNKLSTSVSRNLHSNVTKPNRNILYILASKLSSNMSKDETLMKLNMFYFIFIFFFQNFISNS